MAKSKSRFRSMGGSSKDEMISRTEESKKRQAGGKFADYLVPDFNGSKWSAKEGDHLIDIVPYISGEKDPKLGPDKRSYMIDVWVHQKVGTNEDNVLCPASNYRGKRCPICEHIVKMQQSKQFDDEDIKVFKPKRRVLYNIICYDNTEQEQKGVQLWEASYHLTENEILPLARSRRGGAPIPFADPDEGKSIAFYREGTGPSTRYKGYQFVDREAPISDEDLEAAYCLDELLEIKEYEEIAEMFMTTAPEIPSEDPGRRAVPRKTEEDEPDHEENAGRKSRGLRNSSKPEEEEEQEEEKPARGRRRPARNEEEEKSAVDPEDDIPFDKGSSDKEEETKEEPVRMSRRRRRS